MILGRWYSDSKVAYKLYMGCIHGDAPTGCILNVYGDALMGCYGMYTGCMNGSAKKSLETLLGLCHTGIIRVRLRETIGVRLSEKDQIGVIRVRVRVRVRVRIRVRVQNGRKRVRVIRRVNSTNAATP